MNRKTELGDFLRARRSALQPEEAGVRTYGERRRVPGLRREELALLAGVSASYYTRLEQGESSSASAEVLDALATALRLTESERRYLHDLAQGEKRRPRPRRPAPERVPEATSQLLDTLAGVPVLVLGRRTDVLAWNRLGHALFAGHLPFDAPNRPADRPNMARLAFLDPHTRDLYADWARKARAVAGTLRLVAAQHPEDAALHQLIGELGAKSTEFAAMWADHRVKASPVDSYEMRHPLVGPLTVLQQTIDNGQGPRLVVVTAEAGSPSQAALTLLAHATAADAVPAGPARRAERHAEQQAGAG